MDNSTDTGVTPDSPTDTSSNPPTGSEADTNPSNGQEGKTVPYDRFHEVNESKRAAEERAQQAEEELAQLREQQAKKTQDEDGIDPDTESLVDRIVKKKGYVSKAELEARDKQLQYQSDVSSLAQEYAKTGIPFVEKDVREFAQKEGINITSKTSLRAAYKLLNEEKILEAERNAAITQFKEGSRSGAEKPGSGGAQPPKESKVVGTKNRIREAMKNLK